MYAKYFIHSCHTLCIKYFSWEIPEFTASLVLEKEGISS